MPLRFSMPAAMGVPMLLVCVACSLEPEPPPAPDDPIFTGIAPTSNLSMERVARFDPSVDYFPQKAQFRHATKLSVEYHRHFKVADIVLEGMGGQRQQVLMVQRGTPRPSSYPDAVLVWVPVRRWSAGNFHYGGVADLLGVSDRLVSLGGSVVHATAPGIVRLLKEGRIRQHRSDEQAAALEPEVFLSWTPFLAVMQHYEQLRALGITNLNPVERQEETPLGRSEWIKFLAMLFNKEAEAEAHFARVEAEYQSLAALARGVSRRPRVFVDIPTGNGWQTFGGRNASARTIADAGGEFVFADTTSVSNQLNNPLEQAYDRALDADVWLLTENVAGRPDLPGLIATNPYTRQLPALHRGAVYLKHSGRAGGPNPYWDLGLPNPQWDLADHIKILHPELLPDHRLIFHQPLSSWNARSSEGS
jgi:iron complex transport system substrate-binding protein